MREIKFRGQKDYCKEWTYGNLIQFTWADFIVKFDSFEDRQRVISETVGQFTGLTDKNGKEIYEGDILTDEFCGSGHEDTKNYLIGYDTKEAKFMILDGNYGHYLGEGSQDCYSGYLSYTDELRDMSEVVGMEIIGNKFDNPELIK